MDFAPIVVSSKDAQRILAVGNSKFYQLVAEGKIRRIKIGRRSVFRLEDLHRFVDSCPADGGASVSLPGSATRCLAPARARGSVYSAHRKERGFRDRPYPKFRWRSRR